MACAATLSHVLQRLLELLLWRCHGNCFLRVTVLYSCLVSLTLLVSAHLMQSQLAWVLIELGPRPCQTVASALRTTCPDLPGPRHRQKEPARFSFALTKLMPATQPTTFLLAGLEMLLNQDSRHQFGQLWFAGHGCRRKLSIVSLWTPRLTFKIEPRQRNKVAK